LPTPSACFKDSGRFFRNAEEMFAITSWVQVMLGQHIVPVTIIPPSIWFRIERSPA